MTSSGVYTFGTTTAFDDYINEAMERCGIDPSRISGWQLTSARNSIGYIFQTWNNLPVNLWKVTPVASLTQALTAGQTSFALQTYDLFITEMATRQTSGTTNNDLMMTSISRSEYMALPNKALQSSRPTQYYLERTITPTVYLYPTPQDTSITLIYNVMRSVQDVGAFTNTADMVQRFADALVSELAARLAVKFAPGRYPDLRAMADQAYSIAATEDTENVSMRIIPSMQGRRFG